MRICINTNSCYYDCLVDVVDHGTHPLEEDASRLKTPAEDILLGAHAQSRLDLADLPHVARRVARASSTAAGMTSLYISEPLLETEGEYRTQSQQDGYKKTATQFRKMLLSQILSTLTTLPK